MKPESGTEEVKASTYKLHTLTKKNEEIKP